MRRFVMCLLLTGLSGCSFIPTWTTKGWVKEQMAKVVQDSNLAVAEKIAAVETAIPRDVPPGAILPWVPKNSDWKDGVLTPPDGWAFLQSQFPYPEGSNWAFLKGLKADPANQSKVALYEGKPAHSHADSISGPLEAEGTDKFTGEYTIAPAGSHKHEIRLSTESNVPPHFSVIFIIKLDPEESKNEPD